MLREIVNQVIPHLGIMLMLPLVVPRVISDGERAVALKHKGDGAFRDLHDGRILCGGSSELLVGDAMRDKAALERDAAGLELVRAAVIVAVNETHEL